MLSFQFAINKSDPKTTQNHPLTSKEKKLLIDREHEILSIGRQAELLDISRSSIYYVPVVDEYDCYLMRLIDEQYTKTPFYGSRRMTAILRREGHEIW